MTVLARLPLAATGWFTLLVTTLIADAAPLRIAVVSVFLLLGPGAALLRPLRPALRPAAPASGATAPYSLERPEPHTGEATQNLLLLVMLSLSALVLASTALMLAGAFSGGATLVVLAAVTSVAALCPALPGPVRG
ncbi:hypothetical protein GXW83_25465 [Streptacidiphilus sp. PB12-B1b]|uniref:hypothetical protein n=1 Tax=Streptacidiphilus sp. PB12-B1b TaxID=2705012 RepID=UPI0015FB61B0|nr:hypothetical protein [Streptacidiphilus sp. PB12-B1b]QMU78557.1 hypothetical protein GXW83_25465 [Streptacidiphilus sp. PB12-B1b]